MSSIVDFQTIDIYTVKMLQRCMSLLVILGFVASQLAATPHAHSWNSSSEQQSHDATPHVHLDWLSESQHRHEHTHGGHSHSHSKHKNEATVPLHEQDGSPPGNDSGDHDASAFSILIPTAKPSSDSDRVEGMATSPFLASVVPFVCQTDLKRLQPISWHPPDLAWLDSHRYISLRNLRI